MPVIRATTPATRTGEGLSPAAVGLALVLIGPLIFLTMGAAFAADPAAPADRAVIVGQADDGRRIPGGERSPPPEPPLENPNAVAPPPSAAPRDFLPVPDRWRILDALGATTPNIFDPYNNNVLKADKPIVGQDWFVNFSAISDTLYEPSRVPVSVGNQSTARPTNNSTFGQYGRRLFNQNVILELSLLKADTAYKPPELEVRFVPVLNWNYFHADELGVVNVNPQRGTARHDSFTALQEAFVDYHIRNVSERYDFDSIRVGIQPFSADFRGFLFQDSQFGVRLFGNRDNNRWQYNLAYFKRLQKDTNSGLIDVNQGFRDDHIVVANLYHQDLPVHGFTSQITYLLNLNREAQEKHFDNNGFPVVPDAIGDQRGRNYDVHYIGYNGDGHFGRFNLTFSTYGAFGTQTHNPFNANSQKQQTITAFFAAGEPSVDFDWIRVRLSGLVQSGDSDPKGGRATGFDAPFENPQIAGADTSYWIRQGIPFIGGGTVALTQRNGVLASLKSSKDEGQMNFTNPGLLLWGIGFDFDILPELRFSTNFNHLQFMNTASLEFLRNQANIHPDIGKDISGAFTYRPLQSQNIVMRLSGAVLLPEQGLKELYNTQGGVGLFSGSNYLYSVLANVILTY